MGRASPMKSIPLVKHGTRKKDSVIHTNRRDVKKNRQSISIIIDAFSFFIAKQMDFHFFRPLNAVDPMKATFLFDIIENQHSFQYVLTHNLNFLMNKFGNIELATKRFVSVGKDSIHIDDFICCLNIFVAKLRLINKEKKANTMECY